MTDPRERRAHPRFAVELDVQVEGIDAPLALTTRDVSVGGVFLFARNPLALNRRIGLQFRAGDAEFDIHGVVVHHLPRTGFGVKFDALDDDVRASLKAFLDGVEAAAD